MNNSEIPHVAWFLVLALSCLGSSALAQAKRADEPAPASVPSLRSVADDSRRAIVLDVAFGLGEVASIESIGVSETPPGALDDDPQLLMLVTFDRDGLLLRDQNGWDPRLHFRKTEDGGEEVLFLEESTGRFRLEFDHRIRTLAIFNLRGEPGVPLFRGDITPVIADFCNANPGDVNCDGFAILPLFSDGFES